MSKRSRRWKTDGEGGTAVAERRREGRRQRVKAAKPVDWKWLAISVAAVLFVVVAIYGRTSTFHFVSWDDDVHVYANPHLIGPDGPDPGYFWDSHHAYRNLFIPVTYTLWSAIATGDRTGGDPPFDPKPFHVAAVVLHAINCLLVLFLIRLLLTRGRSAEKVPESGVNAAALIGALVFAAHPLMVESVSWISETKGLLAAAFSLGALICYVQYAVPPNSSGNRAWLWFLGSTALFVLATLSKPTAVTLPLIAFAIDWGWLGRPEPHPNPLLGKERGLPLLRTLPLAGWLLVSVAMVLTTHDAQPVKPTDTLIPSLWQRPLVAGDALTFYLWKTILPLHLNFDYGRTPGFVLAHSWVYATAIAPLVVAVLLWRAPAPVRTGVVVFAAALLPILGLQPFIYQVYSTVADRYAYIAMLGVALIVAWVVARRPGPLAWSIGAIVIAALSLMSFYQTSTWRNDIALYEHGIRENPNSWSSYGNLATALAADGKIDAAEADYRRAIALEEARPKPLEPRPEAYNGLGALLSINRNRPADSLAYFDRAISILPGYPEAHMNRGVALEMLGKNDDAISEFNEAIGERPSFAMAHFELGAAYGNHGDPAGARAQFQQAVDLDPDNSLYQGALKQASK